MVSNYFLPFHPEQFKKEAQKNTLGHLKSVMTGAGVFGEVPEDLSEEAVPS